MIGDYKLDLIVNPLVICENKPHFIENHIIPFAYQKTMNIRFVKSDDLDNVLEFIEKKFYYIENYSESKGSINDLQQLEANFGRKLKYLTFPFTVFGAFILLAMLMQISVLLPMFLNLGLGALFVYCFFLILILIKYNKERKSLMRLISAPYIQNEQRFSEHNLLLIRSELTANQFSQFSYECFGKDTLSIFINELEELRVEPSEESGRDHNPESQNYLKFLQ